MAERLIAPVLKTGVGDEPTGGSNPSPSAEKALCANGVRSLLFLSKWDGFLNAVEKAKTTCKAAGEKIEHHFADVGKMIEIGNGTQRRIKDFGLTHKACYLIAQNGDPTKKPERLFPGVLEKAFRGEW